ncbi:MAG TPA: VRR-NUC domain-containing protein [Gaiellales bacterium]|jgi:hypothetical protein|nr:VRR-NUC domain-containing protein [Gaiellales bacterium]
MTEHAFQTAIIDLARLLGFKVAHFRAARTAHGWRTPVAADGKEFVDLVLAKPGRLIFAECKSEAGRLTKEQRAWTAVLGAAGAEVYVWQVGSTSLQDVADILQRQVNAGAA